MKYIIFTIILYTQILSTFAYEWPLTIKERFLTATFGEYRPGHFHMGVDFKTNRVAGYPCIALDNGYIFRARVSPFGYGKALYIRQNDGKTIVYAHLEKFAPELDSHIRKLMINEKVSRIDKYFSPGDFPVSKGDIVAYAGETGIGQPHLHLEVRDNNNICQNGLEFFDSKMVDNTKPVIKQVYAEKLSPDARILSTSENLLQINEGDTVRFTGEVGILVNTYDQMDYNNENYYASNSTKLFIDGVAQYSVVYDRISYNESNKNEALFTRKHGKRLEKLYINDSFSLECRESGDNGTISFSDSKPHKATVEVSDYSGNTRNFHFYLQASEITANTFLTRETMQNDSIPQITYCFYPEWVKFKIISPVNILKKCFVFAGNRNIFPTNIVGYGENFIEVAVPKSKIDNKELKFYIFNEQDKNMPARLHFPYTYFDNKTTKNITSENNEWKLILDPGCIPFADLIRVETETNPPAIIIETAEQFGNFIKSPQLLYYCDSLDSKGLFLESKKVSFVDNTIDTDLNALSSKISGTGYYKILSDNTPPTILSTKYTITKDGKGRIEIIAKDQMTPINDQECKILLDNQWQIPEYDYEDNLLFAVLQEMPGKGKHKAFVHIADYFGNYTESEIELEIK